MSEIDGQRTYWNGQPCQVRRVLVIVGPSERPTWWCADLEGQERIVLEVTSDHQAGGTFYIDDDEQARPKLTDGMGMWTHGHRSVPVERVVREVGWPAATARTDGTIDERR